MKTTMSGRKKRSRNQRSKKLSLRKRSLKRRPTKKQRRKRRKVKTRLSIIPILKDWQARPPWHGKWAFE